MPKMTKRQEVQRFAKEHGLKVSGSEAKGWVTVQRGEWGDTFDNYAQMHAFLLKIYNEKRDELKPYPWVGEPAENPAKRDRRRFTSTTSPSKATGLKPDARLKKRRAATRKAGPGVYANPAQIQLVGVNPRPRMESAELQALQAATRFRVYDVASNRLLFSAPQRATAVGFARQYADAKGVQVAVEDNDANEARKKTRGRK